VGASVWAWLPACYASVDRPAGTLEPRPLADGDAVPVSPSQQAPRHQVAQLLQQEDHPISPPTQQPSPASARRVQSQPLERDGGNITVAESIAAPPKSPIAIANGRRPLDEFNIMTAIAPASSNVKSNGPPVFVGSRKGGDGEKRWQQMMTWLPKFISAINGSLYRVYCDQFPKDTASDTARTANIAGCHQQVARGALKYWGDEPGTYIDLEDNCYPAQRADFSLIPQAVTKLLAHPDWSFIHIARLPAPVGFVAPEREVNITYTEVGGAVLLKAFGTCELAQAMLDHTDFAKRITAADYTFERRFDEQIAPESVHVIYPAVLQGRRENELAGFVRPRKFFSSETWMYHMREIGFTPWVYTWVDFMNAHAAWLTCCFLPVLVVACITNDIVIALGTATSAILLCWSAGYR